MRASGRWIATMMSLAGLSTAGLSLAGCAVGPDFQPPAPPSVAGYTSERLTGTAGAAAVFHGTAQEFIEGRDLPAEWWLLFGSPPLNDLVRRSLKANPTLGAARAALRQSWELAAAQNAAYYPSFTAGLTASRNLTPTATLSPASSTGNPYYSLITPQISVAFVPDVFGANRRAVESLTAQAEAQRFQVEATYLTLTTNVVSGAIKEASSRAQIAATEETIRIERDLLAILRRQQAAGAISGADVAAQEAVLAQAELALPPLRSQLSLQRDALTALAGQYPDHDLNAAFDLAHFTLPRELPVSLPSKLVAQRPDIRQAESNLHAASANIGQAVAARLPQITLSAAVGVSANDVSRMWAAGTNFWTLAGGLTQPIFDGNALLHKERAARAAFDQASEQYRATVLTSFQNVADTLRVLVSDAESLRAAVTAERAASRGLDIVRKQLSAGQIPYAAVLNAENLWQQARIALVQAQAARLSDTVALFQALGGGWWNRTDD